MEQLSQGEIEFITQSLKCLENCTIRQNVGHWGMPALTVPSEWD